MPAVLTRSCSSRCRLTRPPHRWDDLAHSPGGVCGRRSDDLRRTPAATPRQAALNRRGCGRKQITHENNPSCAIPQRETSRAVQSRKALLAKHGHTRGLRLVRQVARHKSLLPPGTLQRTKASWCASRPMGEEVHGDESKVHDLEHEFQDGA